METKKIRHILNKILCNFIENNSEVERNLDDSILLVILSESSQAIEFVCQIEDEFNIEFEDEEIDLSFFQSIDTIVERINNHLD